MLFRLRLFLVTWLLNGRLMLRGRFSNFLMPILVQLGIVSQTEARGRRVITVSYLDILSLIA